MVVKWGFCIIWWCRFWFYCIVCCWFEWLDDGYWFIVFVYFIGLDIEGVKIDSVDFVVIVNFVVVLV